MKNTIIKIKTEIESEAVQRKLFLLGIFWNVGGEKIQLTDRANLIIDKENSFKMTLSCRRSMPVDIRFSNYCNYVQITADSFLNT